MTQTHRGKTKRLKKLSVYLTDRQVQYLQEQAAQYGVAEVEIVRRPVS